jgi:eukaryotic-like serine/threonine-protein kinase
LPTRTAIRAPVCRRPRTGQTLLVPRERWDEGETEETRVVRPARRRYAEERVEQPPPRRPALWPWLLLLLALVLGGLAAVWYFTTQEDEAEAKPVPAVVRLPEEQARARLQQDGFSVGIRRAPNDAPAGIVFAQTPGAGRMLEEGSVVEIRVSEGPATATVPSVVGLPAEQAVERLEEAELQARPIEVFSEEPEGVVVSQNPAAGEEVRRDSAVRINVSQGTGETTVPDVVGQPRDDAVTALEEAELSATIVEVPSLEPEGTVVAQNPPSGRTVRVGSRVRLNVSAG